MGLNIAKLDIKVLVEPKTYFDIEQHEDCMRKGGKRIQLVVYLAYKDGRFP